MTLMYVISLLPIAAGAFQVGRWCERAQRRKP